MANEVLGVGTTVTFSTSGTPNELRDIDISGLEADDIDITSAVDATANHGRRYKAGFVEPGEITFTLLMTKADFDTIQGDIRTDQTATITLADTSTYATSGYIKGLPVALPYEAEGTYDVVFKCSGNITFTAAA